MSSERREVSRVTITRYHDGDSTIEGIDPRIGARLDMADVYREIRAAGTFLARCRRYQRRYWRRYANRVYSRSRWR